MPIIHRDIHFVAFVEAGRVVATGSIPLGKPLPSNAYRVPEDHVQIGYLVDDKGNFTPADGRTEALKPGEYAGHAGPAAYSTAAARVRAPINHSHTRIVSPVEEPTSEKTEEPAPEANSAS